MWRNLPPYLEGWRFLKPSLLYVEAHSFETFERPLKMKAVCFFETPRTRNPDIERKSSGDLNLNLLVVCEINFVLIRDILPVFRFVRWTGRSDYWLRYVCASTLLSACPYGTNRLAIVGFSWNLIYEYFSNLYLGTSMSSVQCIMFTLPFINQYLCTILCMLNHTLVTGPVCFVLYWHHLQRALSKSKSFASRQVIISTFWPFVMRSQFFKTRCTNLNIIKAPSSRHTHYWRSFIDTRSCANVFKKLRYDNKQ